MYIHVKLQLISCSPETKWTENARERHWAPVIISTQQRSTKRCSCNVKKLIPQKSEKIFLWDMSLVKLKIQLNAVLFRGIARDHNIITKEHF